MPSERHHEPGDLFVKFFVDFPDSIPAEKLRFLEQALPARNPLPKFDKHTILEDVELSDADPDDQPRRRAGRGGDPMDEDEPDEPRVQCAQQ